MSTQITVTLSDDVYRSAEQVARLTGRPISEVLVETIEAGLPLREAASAPPVESLDDDHVKALAESSMDEEQSQRLSVLLDRQQAGSLTEAERVELRALMQIYEYGLLRKAQALSVAVRRSLRLPLE